VDLGADQQAVRIGDDMASVPSRMRWRGRYDARGRSPSTKTRATDTVQRCVLHRIAQRRIVRRDGALVENQPPRARSCWECEIFLVFEEEQGMPMLPNWRIHEAALIAGFRRAFALAAVKIRRRRGVRTLLHSVGLPIC
jgi:hypothetical protein